MYDPRWGDVRERDDGRARVYAHRDQTEHDPRDGLMHDLDLPRGDARELVIDHDRVYELNGEDSRMLAAVGAFRVVPEQDLGTDRDNGPDYDTLDHLRDEGLIRTIVQRLMILDGVLGDRNCWWMGTERDKRSYFATTRHTGLSASEYPQIAFGSGPQKTIRYFPDKLPVGVQKRDLDHYVFCIL